jgi:hypothetical protein
VKVSSFVNVKSGVKRGPSGGSPILGFISDLFEAEKIADNIVTPDVLGSIFVPDADIYIRSCRQQAGRYSRRTEAIGS